MICGSCGEPTPHDPCQRCGRASLLEGRYRLEEVLGAGAQGTTYRATRVEDGVIVVIKELPFHRAALDDKHRELFAREARVLRELDHPCIPRYLEDFVTGTGRHQALCLVQQHIAGPSLAAEAAQRRFAVDDVLAVMSQLLEVLVYLHGLSPPVVHRDLKPANVIRRASDERLVLVDFGSVRDAVEDHDLGGSTVAGTFGYMAPEQLAGNASPASDLYALGVVAVALLTGHDPRTLLDDDGRLHWASAVDAVNPRFVTLLRHLLQPDPARRPASAAWVATEVEALRHGAPPIAPPSRWARPGPGVVLAIVAAAVLAGVTVAGSGTPPATGAGPMLAHAGPEPAPGVVPQTYNARANAQTVLPAVPELAACVHRWRPRSPNEVRVKLRVRPNGTVHASSVNMDSPSLGLDRCVWAWLDGMTFPAPGDERAEVWFNLAYDPDGAP